MRGNNVLGVIFSNMHDDFVHELTTVRTLGSIPFGGRYRLIDFPLSNMVNSGINKVGVVTKLNYQSMMDHLGSGKAWDLSRKHDGLFILPPFGQGNAVYTNRIQALSGIANFLKHSNEEYVMMSDCNYVVNFDMQKMLQAHITNQADITIAYKDGVRPTSAKNITVLNLDEYDRIRSVDVDPVGTTKCNFGLNVYLMRKEYLEWLISDAVSRNIQDFLRDIIQARVATSRIFGYHVEEYVGAISSLNDYFRVNMDLLKQDVSSQLFERNRPVYTKVRDDMPTRYGIGASVKGSLIADGCLIEGEVENSILFRGVHIGKGCSVKNSIIGQDTTLCDDAKISYVVTDKNVVLQPGRTLMGYETYPVFIEKNAVV
ncbi:glucose-1-phosphate adenylyltransferase subunit GlgD [Solibaculum mannosilyticum]|uniref:glucose-1-phosphate adenylyltransferase subunit GlgD n=1 Tax=Solibaculum mannosilyticum TaxID=2780922 RepID=UPI0034A85940